jgi:paired amphipathic helix protein Sin3a
MSFTRQDIIKYRRQAEHHVGADDNLYRVKWVRDCCFYFWGNDDQAFVQNPEDKTMHIQLMGSGEASVDDAHTAINRWREYVDSYVTEHPTEWVQGMGVGIGQPRLFFRR